MNYSKLNDQLGEIQKAITQTTASNLIPSVITTGAAASVPNPAYTVIENAQKKATIKTMISAASTIAAEMLLAAIELYFELPDAVMILIDTLKSLLLLVNAIPG